MVRGARGPSRAPSRPVTAARSPQAGSGQFDDCNAVCMHSGTMRQSLIDVTPFMPVSDFICEYCSQVIVLEEQASSTEDSADSRVEEHKQQLKREHSKKLQLDDETLMVARDVRVLRQRRKLAEEEAARLRAERAVRATHTTCSPSPSAVKPTTSSRVAA